MPQKTPSSIPEEIFHIVALLLPEFMGALDQCQVSGVEMFALICLRHQGAPVGDGFTALPQEEYGKLLRKEFNYSLRDVDVHIRKMEDRGFLQRRRITPDRKKELFGTDKGRLAVVVLLPAGNAKIDEIKKSMNIRYEEIVANLPQATRRLLQIAMPAVRRAVVPIVAILRHQLSFVPGGKPRTPA